MANISYLDTTPGFHSWNRGPDPAVTKRIEKLRQRRKHIIGQAARILSCRSVGGEARVVTRIEKLAALHAEYYRAGCEIISLELL